MLSWEVIIPIGITARAPFLITWLYSPLGFSLVLFYSSSSFPSSTLDNYGTGRNVKAGSENARKRDIS